MDNADPVASDVTRLLNRFGLGDRSVEDELLQRIRADLLRLARAFMSTAPPGHDLQPTALVHEAWLRLYDRADLAFPGRRSFYRFASRVMRSVLVDYARASGARKRGGDFQRVTLTLIGDARDPEAGSDKAVELLDLEAALSDLERHDPELVRLVELRFFGGLSNPEIAAELGTSLRSVERQWRFARAWLHTRLGG